MKIVDQSRKVIFFNDFKISKSFEGRLELLSLNLIIVLWSLKKNNDLENISQELVDIFFQDLDNSLRELGVSEASVGRKIKILAENFYGRLLSYTLAFEVSLKSKKLDELLEKINKNFDTVDIKNSIFINYLKKNIEYFNALDSKYLKNGTFKFKII